MAELSRTSSAEPPAMDAGKWIGRVLIAVLLGEGIWGLIVSLTNNLILPLLSRVMGADAQSPLYLGKGDVNVPALFIALLELWFAAIIAVILNSWVQRKPRLTRAKPVRVSPIPAPQPQPQSPASVVPMQSATPGPLPKPMAPAPVMQSPTAPASSAPPGQFWSPPEPAQPKPAAAAAPPAKPAKPKRPKEVYYNIVGEPITPDDE
jgi:hypothetical protein